MVQGKSRNTSDKARNAEKTVSDITLTYQVPVSTKGGQIIHYSLCSAISIESNHYVAWSFDSSAHEDLPALRYADSVSEIVEDNTVPVVISMKHNIDSGEPLPITNPSGMIKVMADRYSALNNHCRLVFLVRNKEQ